MKKLFLLIPALVLSLVLNAAVINIAPGTSLAYTIIDAQAGDVIVMADGLYPGEDQLHLTKDITIKAAEGAKPVVQTTYYSELKSGAKVYIDGITFDGSNTTQQCIRVYDATAGKELHLNNCEFKNYPKDVISGDKAEYTLDSCVVTNCYFHNNNYSPIYFNKSSVEGKQTIYGLIVKNSTFANNNPSLEYRSVIDVQSYNREATDEIEVLVDHCTFYNNTTINYDYSAVRTRIVNNTTVSNCIFAHPSLIEFYATNVWAGTVTNCLAYNLNKGYMSGPTRTNANTGDPLFTDAANGDFSFAGNWVTMELSPARGAATDGSDLGDPRWYSAEVLPSTDFASPYQFVGAKAQIAGNLWYDDVNGYLYYNDKSECGVATWKINATRACVLAATLNMNAATTTGHKFKVEVLDAEGNSIAETAEPSSKSDAGNIALPDQIVLPAAGNYTVKLYNLQGWSSAIIDGVTFAYVGGAVVTVPAEELVGTEAVLVNAGHLKVSKLANGDLKYGDNGNPLDEYVYWNINATKRGNMKVTLNVVAPSEGDPSSHEFLVELYSDLNESPIASSAEAAATSGTGAKVLPDAINIPAVGNYIVKLTNKKQWSSAILHSIEFEYLGGETIVVPANALIGEEAVLVDAGHKRMSKLENGDLKYGDNSEPLGEYVYWNINATKYGRMDVKLNVVAPSQGNPSGHQFLVELYSDLNESPIVSTVEPASTSTTGAIALPAINIPAIGNYIVKLTNQKQWSSAILHSIELAYAGGEVANVPGQILGVDAMLLKEDGGTLKMYHDENGDIQYNDNGYNLTEYALWNIHADAACELSVTLNIAHSGHMFTVELYDGETLLGTAIEADATKWDGGNIELEDHLNIPAAGNYTIKLINRQQYSGGALHGITFTAVVPPTFVTIDEMAENDDNWNAYVGGDAINVELNRTFKGGMYNTICLPFAVSSDKLVAAFGEGVELLYMNSATLNGNELDLIFAATSSIYQGTPFLIKPVADVVNPQFMDVQIVLNGNQPDVTVGDAANFIGNFIKSEVPAGDQNLFLMQDNELFFRQTATPIKGMRAYFHVNVPGAAQTIQRIRIDEAPAITTGINRVDANGSVKTIENGQLVIIKNGMKYNVMGIKLQ